MSRPDPLEILCTHYAAVLIRAGFAPEAARAEAEVRVDMVLEDLARSGAPVGVMLRRIKVYRLRCQGLRVTDLAERFGISKREVLRNYHAELMRRRRIA